MTPVESKITGRVASQGQEEAQARAWTLAGVAIIAASVLLALSYALPTVRFKAIGSAEEVYSIWGGIVSLWEDGNVVLAPIVFLFSIVFPVAKLVLLAWVWSARRVPGRGQRLVTALQLLGKWSMLDVAIVALFVGSIRIGIATASSRPGIQIFAAAIVVSMIAAHLTARARRDGARAPRYRQSGSSWLHRLTSAGAAAAFAGALLYPLVTVTKGFIFSNQVELIGTSTAMARGGELLLGSFLIATAIILPALRTALSLRIAFLPGSSGRAACMSRLVEEWAMIDVFALALAIVHVKLAELATADIASGFWLVVVAGFLAWIDGLVARGATPESTALPPQLALDQVPS
ncbi:MAG: paraquat-inducible protein A [Planctomycetota bacterium]